MSSRFLLVVRVLGALATVVLLSLMLRAVWAWPEDPGLRVPLSLVFAAGPLVALANAVRPFGSPWARRAVLGASVLAFVTWLAWDDREIVIPLEDFRARIASATPEQRANHALLLRYSRIDDQAPEVPYVGPKGDNTWGSSFGAYLESARREPEVVAVLVEESRDTYAWIVALDAVETWVDLSVPSPTTPIPAFAPLRDATYIAAVHAVLLAERGEVDAAIDHLVPILSVSGKLERSSRLLVGRMVAVVMQKIAMEALGEVLDAGEPDAERKGRLLALLQANRLGEGGVRELAMLEYHGMGWWLGNFPVDPRVAYQRGEDPAAFSLPRTLMMPIFNRKFTVNVLGDDFSKAGELATRRQTLDFRNSRIGALLWSGKPWDFVGKNSVGTMIMTMAVPAYAKIFDSYWEREDQAAALVARLEAPR